MTSSFVGFRTLLYKEILRFWKVIGQTVMAPVLTALLYLMVFSYVLSNHVHVYPNVEYTTFLVPGLIMMSILQNAFANSSSSLIQSKLTGSLIFILLAPLSHWEIYGSYVLAAVARGLLVGAGVFVVTIWFTHLHLLAPWWIIIFALLGAGVLGIMGLIAGIWADRFDQLASFQNFIIVPLTFLAGVFYSVHSLSSPFWQTVSHCNPFFYMVDGFRYGFFGQSDVAPELSLCIVMLFFIALTILCLRMLKSGYKLRAGIH